MYTNYTKVNFSTFEQITTGTEGEEKEAITFFFLFSFFLLASSKTTHFVKLKAWQTGGENLGKQRTSAEQKQVIHPGLGITYLVLLCVLPKEREKRRRRRKESKKERKKEREERQKMELYQRKVRTNTFRSTNSLKLWVGSIIWPLYAVF